MRRWSVHLVLVLVQVLFATAPIAVKVALRELASPSVVLVRASGAAILFLLLQRLLAGEEVRSGRDYLRLALYALFGVVANQLFYVTALSLTTATAAHTLITSAPAITLLVAITLRRERSTIGKWVGIAFAGAGALVLVGVDFTSGSGAGNFLVLLNVLAFSVYMVLSRDLLERYTPLTVITWVFLLGAIGVAPWGIPSVLAESGPVSAGTWLALGWLVALPTVAAYYLNQWALGRLEPSAVSLYAYLQPIVTALLAVPLLGEQIPVRLVPSAVLIFVGVAIAVRSGRRARRAEKEVSPAPPEAEGVPV